MTPIGTVFLFKVKPFESSLFICNSPVGSFKFPTCLTPSMAKISLSFDNLNLDKRALEIPFFSAI